MTRKPQLPILMFLLPLAGTLGVFISPILPILRGVFEISKAEAQNLVTVYLLGCFLGQIPFAPLSNALGRKPALYIGGAIAALGALLCILAVELHQFQLLLWGRCILALGASSGVILTNAFLTDAFTHAEVKKSLAYLTGAFAVIPAFGVAVAGLIARFFPWQGCFYFTFLYILFVMGLGFFLPETAQNTGRFHLHPMKILRGYRAQLSHPRFVLYALLLGCSSIILYLFSAEAPFVGLHRLDLSPELFGFYNLIPNIGLLLGGFLSARLSKLPFGLIGGCFLFLLAALAMGLFFDLGEVNLFSLFGPPCLIYFSFPFIFSGGQAEAIAISENKTYASSVLYMAQYASVGITLLSLHLFSSSNIMAMPMLYAIAGALMILFWVGLKFTKRLR
jgi:MFS family permease